MSRGDKKLMHAFGERLRLERQRLNLTQQALAEVGQITRATQVNYEKGTRMPDAAYLARIAEMGLNISFILGLSNTQQAIIDIEQLQLIVERLQKLMHSLQRRPTFEALMMMAAEVYNFYAAQSQTELHADDPILEHVLKLVVNR